MSDDVEEYEYEGDEWAEKPFFWLDDGKFEITVEHITESKPIRRLYEYEWIGEIPGLHEGQTGPIVRKAFDFCRDRGNVKKQHWKDGENILQKELKVFDDKFLQDNQSDAIGLASVACRFQIRSLFYLMRKRAAEMLAQMTPDDIRKHKLFKTRYVADETTDCDVRWMKRMVKKARWAFRPLSS